ncbi:MAG: hypothetical protein KAT68_05055 [Bacteroidales bacterium]|nr:hypothetical protein [Bacteroidales bacterium]
MKNKLLKVIFLITYIFGSLIANGQSEEFSDYKVYDWVLDEIIQNEEDSQNIEMLVIEKNTYFDNDYRLTELYDESFLKDTVLLYSFYQELIDIKDGKFEPDTVFINLLKKFCSLPHTSQPLQKDNFNSNYKIKLISDANIKWIFRNKRKDNWWRFYRKYPNSYGIIEISDIVWSEDKRYCLLYFGVQRYGLVGGGYFILIDTKSNIKIKNQLEIWIS